MFDVLEPPLPGQASEGPPAGFAALPQPNPGDVFLDFEGHPFWKPDSGLFFLFGLIERSNDAIDRDPAIDAGDRDWQAALDGAGSDWDFVEFWAHDANRRGAPPRP